MLLAIRQLELQFYDIRHQKYFAFARPFSKNQINAPFVNGMWILFGVATAIP